MNINDFRYITTIAELGNFTSAAKQLYIAQPSLSQRVKYIEKTYNINIFIRDSRSVKLTNEGKCFVKHAKEILNIEENLRREIADMHNPEQNILRIGTTQFIRSYLFDSLIQGFHGKHPKMQLEFIEGNSQFLQENLLNGKLDIAICYLPVINPEISYQQIFQDRFVLVPAAGGLLSQKILDNPSQGFEAVPFDFLKNEPFAIMSKGTKLHDYILSQQEQHGIKLDIQHYGKNHSILYYMAKSGIASTILYESFFDPLKDYIPYYYLEDGSSELSVAIMWRKGAYLLQAAKEIIRIAQKIQPGASGT